MAEKITIAELDINTDALLQSSVETRKAFEALTVTNKELKKSTEDTTEAQIKNDVAIKNLKSTYATQTKTLSALTDATNKQAEADKVLTDELNKEITTENQATESNKKLLAIRKQVNTTTEAGRKQVTQINSKIDANNKLLKENASEQGKVKIGVGGYEQAIRSVFPQVGALTDGLKAKKLALQSATLATGGLSKASRVLRIALISTGIGAIVVAFGSLVSFLTTTQRGMDAVTRVTKPLQVIFQSLLGVVQDMGGALFDAFSNPKQLLVDLLDFLKGQVINRFKALGVILEGIVNLDFEKISNGLLQVGTGVEDVIGKVKDLSKETSDFFGKAVEDGNKLRQLNIDIEERSIGLNKRKAEANLLLREEQTISKNINLSNEERLRATNETIRLSAFIAEQDNEILDMKIEKLKIEQTLNDTAREGAKELADLEAERIQRDASQRAQAIKFISRRNALEGATAKEKAKEEADRARLTEEERVKELDRIETFENQKRELKNQIDLENAATQEEKDILKAEQDFEKQILALEQLQLNEDQKTELLSLIEEQRGQVLADIQKDVDAKKVKAILDTNKKENAADKTGAKERAQIAGELNSILTGLLGDSLGARIASIAIEAASQAGLVGIDTAAAQARNLATATALGPPANVVAIPTAVGQNVALGAKSAGSIGKIFASAAIKSVGSIAKSAFYEGGTIGGEANIPTSMRNSGGDDVLIQAKRGEVILNENQQARAGGSAFFNSIGVPGFQTGGIVGATQTQQIASAAGLDMDAFATVIAERINDIKVVAIEQDITSAQALTVEIVSGADI